MLVQEDDHGISLASDGLSLRLPSGRTLGHRSLKVYYQQNLRPESQPLPDSTSTALTTKLRSVRAKLADPSLSLVPVGGGAGAFGKGQMVMKARNAGEAKWAKKLGRSHLDQRKKEAPRQLVSMRGGNNQVSSTISSLFVGESGMLTIFSYGYSPSTETLPRHAP